MSPDDESGDPKREGGPRRVVFPDPAVATSELRSFMADFWNRKQLRAILAEELAGRDIGAMSDREVLEQVGWRLSAGRTRLLRRPPRAAPVSTAPPREPAEQEEEDDEPPAPVVEKDNWFRVRVVDDETEDPVSGVSLRLALPGRDPKTYAAGGGGEVLVRDLAEGTADILAMGDEEAYEVVAVE